jgi:queuosine precursor transporter
MSRAREENGRRYSGFFVIIVAVFITCLITANVIAVKLVDVFGMVMPAGVLVFPLSYIAGDVLTEVYGYRQARRVIWLGFLCNAIAVCAIVLGQSLPAASFWDGQSDYERILGQTPRLLMASFLAYLLGEFANSFVLAKLKIATAGRWLWMRTIGSTVIGEGLDSIVFILIAFSGTIPTGALAGAVMTQWLAKTGYEVIATPVTYLVVRFLKKQEQVDVFDHETRFNPLLIT